MFHEHQRRIRVNSLDEAATVAAHAITSTIFGLQHAEGCPMHEHGDHVMNGSMLFVVTGKEQVDEVLRPNDQRLRAFLQTQRSRENSRWN